MYPYTGTNLVNEPSIILKSKLLPKVIGDESVDESFKHLLLEVVVKLSETAPGMLRKVADKYLARLVPLVLKMMTELEEDEEWSLCDEQAEEDQDSSSVVAESSLDRLLFLTFLSENQDYLKQTDFLP